MCCRGKKKNYNNKSGRDSFLRLSFGCQLVAAQILPTWANGSQDHGQPCTADSCSFSTLDSGHNKKLTKCTFENFINNPTTNHRVTIVYKDGATEQQRGLIVYKL